MSKDAMLFLILFWPLIRTAILFVLAGIILAGLLRDAARNPPV